MNQSSKIKMYLSFEIFRIQNDVTMTPMRVVKTKNY